MLKANSYIFFGVIFMLAVSLSLLGVSPVNASQAVPVKIEVAVESPSLRRAWGENRIPEIESALAQHWLNKLGKKFLHWDFHQEVQPFFAAITLKVVERESRKIKIVMEAKRHDGLEQEELWEHTWLEPVDFDLGQRPTASRAQQSLRDKSEALFGKSEQERLRLWLHATVPLGKGGLWQSAADPDQLRVITSLPWDRFQKLKSSVFNVYCRDDGEEFQMESAGTLNPLIYENDRGDRYDALVLKPRKVSDAPVDEHLASELDDSEVHVIFLLKEQAPDSGFFF